MKNIKEQLEGKLTVKKGIIGIVDDPIEIFDGYYYIPGYHRYLIRKDGVLWDWLKYDHIVPKHNGNNYPSVSVQKDGSDRQSTTDIHLLLALAFIPLPDIQDNYRLEVNHIDHDRTNYSLSNLEWISKMDNYKHGRAMNKRNRVHSTYTVQNGRSKDIRLFNDLRRLLEVLEGADPQELDLVKMLKEGEYTSVGEYLVTCVVHTSSMSMYSNPVVIVDYLKRKTIVAKTVTDAALLTGFKRSSITESMLNGSSEFGAILSGYRFFNPDDMPDEIRNLTLPEKIFHQYSRSSGLKNHNGVGYVVYDQNNKILFPAVSLRDMPNHFKNPAYTYPRLGVLSRYGFGEDRFVICPIYEERGSSKTSHFCDQLHNQLKDQDLAYMTSIPKYYDE